MTQRAFWFAVTQRKVLTFLAIGIGLLVFRGPPMAAMVMFGIAFVKAMRVLSHDDLDLRLRLQDEKRRAGIQRMLSESERREVFALDHYAARLRDLGANPDLCREVMAETWRIIRSAGAQDATSRLKMYRHNLPALRAPEVAAAEGPDGIANRIQRELDLLQATEQELRAVG